MMRVRVALVRKSPEANWNKGRSADLSGVMAIYFERADSGQVEVLVWARRTVIPWRKGSVLEVLSSSSTPEACSLASCLSRA